MSAAAQQILRQAQAEGVELIRSDTNKTGYHLVTEHRGGQRRFKPYYSRVWRDGKYHLLGYFDTAEEAAFEYAKTPEATAGVSKQRAERERRSKAAEQALSQAQAEGLPLHISENTSGYKCVYPIPGNGGRFRVECGGCARGVYETKEEAALAFARTPEGRALDTAAPAPAPASAAATATARAAIATEQWRREEEQEQKEAQEQEQKEAQEQDEREEREAREEKKARREERKAKKEEKRAEEATAARRAQKKAREGKQAKRAAKAAAAAVPTRSEEEAKSVRKAAKRRAQEAEVDQPKKKLKKKLESIEGLSDLVKGLPYHVHTAALAWFKKEELASVEIITECKMEDIFVAALGFNTPPPKGAEIVLRNRLADLHSAA